MTDLFSLLYMPDFFHFHFHKKASESISVCIKTANVTTLSCEWKQNINPDWLSVFCFCMLSLFPAWLLFFFSNNLSKALEVYFRFLSDTSFVPQKSTLKLVQDFNHRLTLTFVTSYQSCSKIVWYFSCKKGPNFKTSRHLRADSLMLKNSAPTRCVVRKSNQKRKVSKQGCEKEHVNIVVSCYVKDYSEISEVEVSSNAPAGGDFSLSAVDYITKFR